MNTGFSLAQRRAGILLHPTSLPGPHGCGDLGPPARRFVDFLAAAGQGWWQMLPTGPAGPGNSPYSAYSAFAGNPLLVSLELLAAQNLLTRAELASTDGWPERCVDFPATTRFRLGLLRRAHARFVAEGGPRTRSYAAFCESHRDWLDDYALYTALRRAQRGRRWLDWPPPLRLRRPAALRAARRELHGEIELVRFIQFAFDQQWTSLRDYAARRGVAWLGDVPIFVALDSADVWAHQELFALDAAGQPRVVSGVPPDYFNRNGQLWGHPHYRWARHRATGFAWWIARFRRALTQFAALRIDHFLGFHQVWAVPGRAKTARRGRYLPTPGRELLGAIRRALGRLELVAEDLGNVTPAALALRDEFGFPGMRVLQFAFGNDTTARYHQPHQYPQTCVVYTGTHDNATAVEWMAELKSPRRARGDSGLTPRERLLRYLGTRGQELHWDLIRLAYLSVANLAIIPAQDVLGLGAEARMNTPGQARGNWAWRMPPRALSATLAARLHRLAETYQRLR